MAAKKGMPSKIPPFEECYDIDPITGCYLWKYGKYSDGYGNYKNKHAQRVAWELYRGPIPDGLQVLHSCDTRDCVNVEHLFLGTNADNVDDKVNKGRQHFPKGVKNGRAKLTEEQVNFIRKTNLSWNKLGKKLGISKTQFYRVKKGESWT